MMEYELLDINGSEDPNHDDCGAEILELSNNVTYQDFFSRCLLKNEPCIIKNVAEAWNCLQSWISIDDEPDLENISKLYGGSLVTAAQCDKKIYNVHKKVPMTVSEYCSYWKHRYEDGPRLYLKDWHFTKDYPDDNAYRVPKYFASDWLNEHYNNHPELNDDYRFVYIGPKGTWTPLHADVFTSYSWSVNVVGRKRWIFLRPGVEEHFRDKFGNLIFSEELDMNVEHGAIYILEQGPRDAIFVPSGWHHQVWNLEDTISINHNWINGCNILSMWTSMNKSLMEVKKEIEDCKDMDGWDLHCQIMLKALYGFDYIEFYKFLVEIVTTRMVLLSSKKPLKVYGSWLMGPNHLLFDIKQAMRVFDFFLKDPDVSALMDTNEEWRGKNPSIFVNDALKFLRDSGSDFRFS